MISRICAWSNFFSRHLELAAFELFTLAGCGMRARLPLEGAVVCASGITTEDVYANPLFCPGSCALMASYPPP